MLPNERLKRGRQRAAGGHFPAPAAAAAAALFVAACFLPGCESRETQKQVVVYCSVDQVFAEPILDAFEEQTGIKVLARFDTEASKTVGLVQRLRAEKAAPAADVFWSSEVFYTIRLAREGLFAGYQSESTKAWPRQFRDRGSDQDPAASRWYGFALRAWR